MRAALVVNPAKVDDPAWLRRLVAERSAARGWDEPLYLPTTSEDFGTEVTRGAVADGVDVVLACGGDGTIMAVVTGLTGTGVPLGILPCGTGNLLARNLGLPRQVPEAVELALAGELSHLDVGRIGDRRFVVMAGVGLDAAMVADAPEGLKRALGWPAYVVSALRHLGDRSMVIGLQVDDGPRLVRRARTVVVGNVGELQGGVPLLPDADPRDGVLDVVVVSARTPLDWALVVGRVLRRRQRSGDPRLEVLRGRRIEIRTTVPQPYQLDGDPLGTVTSLVVEVEPRGLTVKVPPAPARRSHP